MSVGVKRMTHLLVSQRNGHSPKLVNDEFHFVKYNRDLVVNHAWE